MASKDEGKNNSEEPNENETILKENLLSKVRNAVTVNKIRLWLEPYYVNVPMEDALLQLAENLSSSLDLDVMQVLECLKDLQERSLEKLQARTELATSGRMRLKIKLSKALSQKASKFDNNVTVEAGSTTAQKLAEDIAQQAGLSLSPSNLMLICEGQNLSIRSKETISGFNIKPRSSVLVIEVNPGDQSWQVVQEQQRILQLTKSDAKSLGATNDLEIANQDGVRLDLPKAEKDALILAMSCHEKGRAAMKRLDYQMALVFLLEASQQYRNCRAEILKVADNYGLLNLDLAWCYLHLGSINELPDAMSRLQECEQSLMRCYGSHMERVTDLKGSSNHEAALLLRLKILKAVVAFSTGHSEQASDLLREADLELQRLEIPADLIDEVVAQGYTQPEARLALRATGNQLTDAVRYAQSSREKRDRLEKEEAERRRKRKELGKTENGSWVNLGYLKTIVDRGVEEKLAALALRRTNNDLDAALIALDEDIATLLFLLDEETITPEKISFVSGNGFDEDSARRALQESNGDVEQAIVALSEPSTSRTEAEREAKRAKREAKSRLSDVVNDSDNYLDLTLDEEKLIIDKYKNLIKL